MKDKKKILLLTRPICPPWDEGSKNFAYSLAKHVSGFEIHLLTCGKDGSLASNWKLNFQANVVCHDIYTSPKWNFGQKVRAYLFLIWEFLVKGGKKYDILHSFFTPTRLNVFALKLCLRNKKIKTIQTLATLRDDLYDANKLKKIIHTDCVITYSDYAKEKLEKMGFDDVQRIYPGIDMQKYSPAPEIASTAIRRRGGNPELMKKYETTKDDFVINYTGEYVRLGDMDDIIAVFSDLALDSRHAYRQAGFRGDDNKCRFKLHLAVRVKNEKDAVKKREIIEKLKKNNILDRVVFIDGGGYEMQDVYNLCDVSIFPARTMAGKFDIPLAVIEAMACGKPVIASNLERLRYFLNADNSILIEPGGREALKEKILYLYENPEERRTLGEKGMHFVRENFDIKNVVKEYEKIYSNLSSRT